MLEERETEGGGGKGGVPFLPGKCSDTRENQIIVTSRLVLLILVGFAMI